VAERRAPLSHLGGGSRSASGSASRANSKPTNRATHEEEANSRREFGRRPGSQRRSTSGSRPAAASGCNFRIVIICGRGRPPRIDRHDAMIVEVPGTPALSIPARRRHRCRCRRRRRRRRRSRPPPVLSSLSPRCASLCVSPFFPRSTSTSPRLARPCARPARRRSGLRRVQRISFRQRTSQR